MVEPIDCTFLHFEDETLNTDQGDRKYHIKPLDKDQERSDSIERCEKRDIP